MHYLFILLLSTFVNGLAAQGLPPLKSLKVTGEFLDSLGEVVIAQQWYNDEGRTITSNYKFSLDSNAVVTGYHMTIGDKSWVGVVKEKDTAKAEYQAAVDAGVKASLFEKLSPTDYQVSIGPMEPFQTAEVVFSYITRAEVERDGSYRFTLPTNIAPKYTGQITNSADVQFAHTVGSIPHTDQPPYTFDVDITWSSGSAVQEILSTTNPITTEVLSGKSVRVRCLTAPSHGDFTLLVRPQLETTAYSYSLADGTKYLYIHNQIPDETVANPGPKKITIVVDRSGSMDGEKMREAVKAVDSFLALFADEPSTLINVVSFGSYYRAQRSHSIPATRANIDQLRAEVRTFQANFGGTELLPVLTDVVNNRHLGSEHAVNPPVELPNTEHVVVVLTDGQVSNLNSIVDMLGRDSQHTRIMTVGIGHDADRRLVQQLADKTHALCKVLVDESDLTAALADIKSYIHKRYFKDVKVVGHYATQGADVLYPAHPIDMFLRLKPEEFAAATATGLLVTAVDPVRGSTKVWTLPVGAIMPVGPILEKIYASQVIEELGRRLDRTSHEALRPESAAWDPAVLTEMIVKLSVAHGVMSSHTSFVVISDERVSREINLNRVQNVEVAHHAGQAVDAFQKVSMFASQPTHQPLARPSCQPSIQPTSQPTIAPTTAPTVAPTVVPTNTPTNTPTAAPTIAPTMAPTVMPSVGPTLAPSVQSSTAPTIIPTSMPSSCPAAQPSRQSSRRPTSQPSRQPTRQPSSQPTGSPSTQSSGQPTAQPSGQPSMQPSSVPTACPSVQPSGRPTGDRFSVVSGSGTLSGGDLSLRTAFASSSAHHDVMPPITELSGGLLSPGDVIVEVAHPGTALTTADFQLLSGLFGLCSAPSPVLSVHTKFVCSVALNPLMFAQSLSNALAGFGVSLGGLMSPDALFVNALLMAVREKVARGEFVDKIQLLSLEKLLVRLLAI